MLRESPRVDMIIIGALNTRSEQPSYCFHELLLDMTGNKWHNNSQDFSFLSFPFKCLRFPPFIIYDSNWRVLGLRTVLLDKRNLNLTINLDQMCRLNDNDTVELLQNKCFVVFKAQHIDLSLWRADLTQLRNMNYSPSSQLWLSLQNLQKENTWFFNCHMFHLLLSVCCKAQGMWSFI